MNLTITEEERKLLLDALERHQSTMQANAPDASHPEAQLREAWEAGQLYDRINRLL